MRTNPIPKKATLNKRAQGIITENNLVFFSVIILAIIVGVFMLFTVRKLLWVTG